LKAQDVPNNKNTLQMRNGQENICIVVDCLVLFHCFVVLIIVGLLLAVV